LTDRVGGLSPGGTDRAGPPRRCPEPGLIHHSDRGSQYRSLAFDRTLRDSGIKNEWLKRYTFRTRDEARLTVLTHTETFYNPERRHSALGYRSPIEYEKMLKENCIETVQV